METIIASCISGFVTLIVCIVTNKAQQARTEALLEYKLDELTKRVDKHNNVIERTFKLEERMSLAEQGLDVANHRIKDLEG